jgi:hypothetical protein
MNLKIIPLLILLACCAAPGGHLSVHQLLSQSSALDNEEVKLKGRLEVEEHGLINIYSRDGKQCVGLLLSRDQMARYAGFARRQVLVTGRLEKEGCGRDGFCDEHLCGPAVLKDATVEPSS